MMISSMMITMGARGEGLTLVGGRVTGLGDGQSKVTPNFTQAIKIISIAFVV